MKQIDLNGLWSMVCADGRSYDCSIPGSVAACLLEHGAIPDPYVSDNEAKVLPVFEEDYTFRRKFTAAQTDLAHDRVLLHCEGLDTIAAVMLNGQRLGTANNMHRSWVFDVKDILVPGENELELRFTSALQFLKDHPSVTGKRFATIRKAACMFGWDWGIELPDMGIWRDIYIEHFDCARLEHVQVEQTHQDGEVCLNITAQAEHFDSAGEAILALELTDPSGSIIYAEEKSLRSGSITFHCSIAQPQLWWPVGYGAQPLYDLQIHLRSGECVLDQSSKQIGLRTLVLDRSRRGDGDNYGFVVNGKPIFFRGENLIIADAILSRSTPARWQQLIDNCLRSNLNGLRVWGGACYPPEEFYALCDRHGLMVFQDFMFACTFYASTKEFMANVRAETEENLRRIAHHACIALYCGNNELDCIYTVMTSDEPETAALRKLFGGGDKLSRPIRAIVRMMYRKLFMKGLPSLCTRYAPGTSYVHSSPSLRKPFRAKSFFDYLSHGDMHYYLQYNDNAPYQKLREFHVRFMSEMGFQSYPSMKTIDAFAEKADQSPYCAVMYAHQKCKNGNEAIELYMEREYRVPEDFAQYVYLSQLQAGEIMKYSVEHLRRDSGYCRGMIIWQLNDCWPVVSWSGIDYFGRWKAQQYYTKRFYAPVLVSADVQEGIADIWVSNDSTEPLSAQLRWQLCAAGSEVLAQGETAVSAKAGSSAPFAQINYAALLTEAQQKEHYLAFELTTKYACLGSGTALFVPAKEFRFHKPQFALAVEEQPEGYAITLSADCFAKGVSLDTMAGDCLFSDNFFDLSAGQVKGVFVEKKTMVDIAELTELENNLTITCLNHVMIADK